MILSSYIQKEVTYHIHWDMYLHYTHCLQNNDTGRHSQDHLRINNNLDNNLKRILCYVYVDGCSCGSGSCSRSSSKLSSNSSCTNCSSTKCSSNSNRTTSSSSRSSSSSYGDIGRMPIYDNI